MKRMVLGLVALALLSVGAAQAKADPITISVGGATFSAGADVVTLSANTVTLDLTAGVPLTTNIQPGTFHIGDSGTLNQTFPFTLSRPVTINGVAQVLSQSGQLAITPTADTLTLSASLPTTFNLGGGSTAQFNFLGLTSTSGVLGDFPIVVPAVVSLSSPSSTIPEPASLTLFGVGTLGLLGYRWRKRAAPASS
jgi:hypothetical protein